MGSSFYLSSREEEHVLIYRLLSENSDIDVDTGRHPGQIMRTESISPRASSFKLQGRLG